MTPAALLAFVAFASSPPPACASSGPAAAAVRAVAEGIVAADNRGDLAGVLAFYASDAVLLPPNEEPVVGQGAIRPRYEALFAGFRPEIEMEVHEACVAGALGYVRGHNGGRLVPRAGGEPRRLDDAFVMLLRHESGAGWRISHLMWHPQRAPAR